MSNAPISGKKKSSSNIPPKVHKDMIVQEVLSLCPQSADIMAEYGLHCFSCSIGGAETMQQGCEMHGFDADTINALLEDLNEVIAEAPMRPQEITITKSAAEHIKSIAETEGFAGQGLILLADPHGGFCMEFSKNPEEEDTVFTCKDVPEVRVFCSPMTLWRIGGATIDFREERFKLDLPEDRECDFACDNNSCGCAS